MNHADIKVGKYYTLQLLCTLNAEKIIVFGTASGDHIPLRQCDLECVTPTPSEPPTLVGTTPKHDPSRKFRKGDKVRLIAHRGRIAYDEGLQYPPCDTVYIVEHDELKNGIVSIYEQPECDFDAFDIHFSFLELVTPVEDVEPYIVEKSTDGATIVWTVKKRDCSQGLDFRYCPGWGGNIFFSETHCRKHAEAECARLNEEYRKEQK